MTGSSEKATPAVAFCYALNHLLEAEGWARAKLAAFVGESVELRAPPLPQLRFTIQPGGAVQAGGPPPSLVITLKPELLAGLARGEEHLMRSVEVSGNARLAAEVMGLVRHLRWDFEEDLSRVLGDALAHRVAATVRELAAWHLDAARRVADALALYAVEEKRLLVRRGELESFARATAELRDALERLDKRIERLG